MGALGARRDKDSATSRLALIAPCVAIAAGGALLVWCSRGLFFVQDEWDLLQNRLLASDSSTFLVAHNQHIAVLEVALYKAIYGFFGLRHYWLYQAPHIAGQLIALILVFAVLRRRLGATVGFFAVLPLVALGTAWETLLLPFNGTLVYPMVSLLAVLLLLERDDWRGDAASCILLVLAVGYAEFGALASLGVLVRFLWSREWRRAWVPVVPLILYGLWYLNYGLHAAHQAGYRITAHPVYLFDLIAGSVSGLLGIQMGSPQVAGHPATGAALRALTVLLLLGLGLALVTRRQRLTPYLVTVLTVTSLWWAVLTLTRGYMGTLGSPYVSHYLYISVILIVLIAAGCWRARPIGKPVLGGLAIVSGLVTTLNVAVLLQSSDQQRHRERIIYAEVGALQLADPARLPPSFQMDGSFDRAPEVTAGRYALMLELLHTSPAPDAVGIEATPEYARAAADRILTRASGVSPRPYTEPVRRRLALLPKPAPLAGLEAVSGASSSRFGGCLRVTPVVGSRAVFSLVVPEGGLLMSTERAGILVRLRLFAHHFSGPPMSVAAPTAVLPAPRDPVSMPWHVQLLSTIPAVLCPA